MKKRNSFINLVLLPLLILINYFFSFFPSGIETVYSSGINKPIVEGISSLTGIFKVSLAEIFVIMLAILLITYLSLFIKTLLSSENKPKFVKAFLIKLLLIITCVYASFLFLWGLNYHRLPFSTISNLKVQPASLTDLISLCEDLIESSNNLRSLVSEDQSGIMFIEDGPEGVLTRAEKGFSAISKSIPELGGNYGRPKGIFFSKALSYTGIAGIYFPFTGEANVNTNIPPSTLPSTTSHEMAHQRGFAREDEANYIAYLACLNHPDIDFQYSGTILALVHSMNALYRYDKEKYMELRSSYTDGVSRDIMFISSYWAQFEGPVERTSTKINNAYLKSNLQEDGVYSYGRMVDLLLAEYKMKNNQ